MRNMKKWRTARKAVAFGLQFSVLVVITSMAVLPGMIARCRSLAEVLILLAVLCGMAVCAGCTAWLSVEYDRKTASQWREYRRMMRRIGAKK